MTEFNPIIGYKKRLEVIVGALLRDLETRGPIILEDLLIEKGLQVRIKDFLSVFEKLQSVCDDLYQEKEASNMGQKKYHKIIQDILHKIENTKRTET